MRLLSLSSLLVLVGFISAAPALAEKPPRWEYGELSYRTVPGRPAGVDPDGNQIAAVPSSAVVKWISGAGEVEAKSWAELAEKLKALGSKKDGSAVFQKIQFLNHLGSEGWEIMEQGSNTTTTQTAGGFGRDPAGKGFGLGSLSSSNTWMMKRRLP